MPCYGIGMAGAISVRGLRKSYGSVTAVNDVSFDVEPGEFFGILGPNGAGKTTTLEMIEGLREPDDGELVVLGVPPWPRNPALLPRIGVQLQASSFFERLTAREQIRTFASLYGVGVRMDEKPELFFELRGVDHTELVGGAATAAPGLAAEATTRSDRKVLEGADLSALFGIELDGPTSTVPPADRDGAGNRFRQQRQVPQPRRAKPVKRAEESNARLALPNDSRGTRTAQKHSGDRKRR